MRRTTSKNRITTAQIGAAGVLLVQYQLLKYGIESAPMTSDAGIDLVAYSPAGKRAVTIQVKACLRPKPGGGKGSASLDWWLRNDSPAELVALVNLADDCAWLFRHREFEKLAQQKSSGRLHFYFYTAPGRSPHSLQNYLRYVSERRMVELFG